MFPCLISKAATVDVISDGEGPNRDGAVQLVSCVYIYIYINIIIIIIILSIFPIFKKERKSDFFITNIFSQSESWKVFLYNFLLQYYFG
jgi:hypothetical protein